jgi:hypothetical protein
LCLALFAAGSTDTGIAELRSGLKKAEASEEDALRFYRRLQAIRPPTPMIEGYLAATEGLLAKHAFLPTTKYSRCKQALEGFRKAIAAEPANLELRYLRLAVETHLPSFLGMSGDIPADRDMALRLLPACDDRLLRRDVARLLLENGDCTPAQKNMLKGYLD